jgi:diguanylate cyclase (GGDEF)-like protein
VSLIPIRELLLPTPLESGPDLADLAVEVAVVRSDTPVDAVDRLFRADRQLRAIIVQTSHSVALLSREHLQYELSGRLGFGRALHARATAGHLLPHETFTLPGHLTLAQAAQRILDRPESTRDHDVLVVTEQGPRVVSVSHIFERLSTIFRHVALHDPLTGLPNRRLLDEQGADLVNGEHDASRVAILYIDLDGFKAVNDTFGHRVGDEILIGFAERLRGCVRPGDTVARLGGDEFAALLLDVSEVQALAIADRVVLTATAPFVHDDQLLHLSATVGIAMASDVAHERELTQLDVLLRHADGAMMKAKEAGKRQVGRLDGSHETAPFARQGLIRRRLREALDSGAFTLHYQPKLDLATGTCDSVEALLRWEDRELGTVSPAEFIPIAEASDQIHRIGQWVINEACSQARAWLDAGTPRTIAVNVSPVQLATRTIVSELISAVRTYDIPAELLRVEITEGSAVADLPRAIEQLQQLRDVGIDVDLDDFGTGYSSLAMLRHLPLSAVKIDKAFIDHIDTTAADALLVRGVIDAAHALGLGVTAEGVERPGQLERLRELGCDTAQGFLISRPVSALALESTESVGVSIL